MPTTRETILTALHARLSALAANALRGEVLPERVPAEGLLILRDGEPGEPDVTLSPLRYRSIDWINAARLRYDALTYQWQAWVVNFNSEQQYTLLNDLFGEISPKKFVVVLLGTWALVLLPVGLSLMMRPVRGSDGKFRLR